jgi:ferrous-iron efflux pump FieF
MQAGSLPPDVESQKRLMRAATIAALVCALILVGVKAAVYFDTRSVAILSSLADSALDLLASVLTLFAVRVALTPADEGHRFGHGKAEPLSGLGQSAFIGGSAALVMVEAISRFHSPRPIQDGTAGIIVMLVAIVMTLGLVTFQRYVIKRTGSLAISGDSLHYTGDLLMNASVIAALFLSDKFGLLWIDPLFGVGISAFLMINAVRIATSAVGSLMDHELPDEVRAEIAAIASGHPQVKRVHDLRTRSSGLQKFIQMHIVLDSGISLMEAHRISDAVEKALAQAFPGADIIIHQDPDGVLELHTPLGGVL